MGRHAVIYNAIGEALTEFETPEGLYATRADFAKKLADAVEAALCKAEIAAEVAELPNPVKERVEAAFLTKPTPKPPSFFQWLWRF